MTTKDTLTEDNEALIAEMLADAKTVELPSELRENPIIHRGDDELEAPMTVKELTSAGYVYLWDSRTYERAPVLRYMANEVLRRRREDGSRIWTAVDPHKRPKRGTHKCLLHQDSPSRAEYDAMGLRTCKKSNIINEFEVKQHMLKKHPKEWMAIEDKRKEAERQEDRADAKLLREALVGKPNLEKPIATIEEKPPLYVSNKDKKKAEMKIE